jgi:hypothetical protein
MQLWQVVAFIALGVGAGVAIVMALQWYALRSIFKNDGWL